MNSDFGALAQAEHLKRTRSKRVWIVIGLILMALGYVLMAVDPQTRSDWAAARVLGGLLCIIVGFGWAVMPLLASWTRGE